MKDFESNRTQIMNSIENRVRQAYNSGYDMGFHDGKIACKFVGAKPCTVARAWRDKSKCRGYNVIRIGNKKEMR